MKTGRELMRAIVKKTRFTSGKAQGILARGRRLVTHPAVSTDDSVVAQRIRSEAFRDLNVSASDFDVRVENGIATVRGSVPDDEVAAQIVTRVAKVAGVADVAPMLRVAEREPAGASSGV